ncbi:hypothetical protein [Roseateles asaccharophilus]|uniref:Porin n=1 Tax=Roseateles asaccharophilus TaxID=582607 RepID=A0ABU2AD25_9BURK|nr:hypothetical protein [Roseateles asaccharophilus]MDR7334498.1 hypothetical protein [Roseateles asaccharophilus]
MATTAHGQQAERPGGSLRLSGFGTLGLSHVDTPPGWGFRRELTQSADDGRWHADVDSRLGVQLNYSLGTRFELVAQVIAKKRGHYAADGDALEWAYATYRPNADWTLRAGRVNVDAFLMADYRNVGYGFTAARPSVELYSRLPTTLDGADVARSWFQGDAQWRAKLMLGTARIGDLHTAKASRIRQVVGGMLSREEGGLLVRASVARTRIDIDLTNAQPALDGLAQLGQLPIPAVADQARVLRERLGATGVWATFWELGLRHELADWQWSAEFVRVAAKPLTVENMVTAMLGHRLGDWTPYISYGIARNSLAVLDQPAWQAVLTPVIGPLGAAQAQMLGSVVTTSLNNTRVHQSTWSLGTRWDFHTQAALKLQWDRVRVQRFGAALWTGADGSPATVNVATAVVDFIF